MIPVLLKDKKLSLTSKLPTVSLSSERTGIIINVKIVINLKVLKEDNSLSFRKPSTAVEQPPPETETLLEMITTMFY